MINPDVKEDRYSLYLGDCLNILPTLDDKSIDAIITDIPYYDIVKDDWDNQWKDRNEYLDWVVSLAHEWKRIAKDNSSIFMFCDEKMEAYIQVRLDKIFLLLNKIVWFKRNNLPQKNAHLLRTFAPMTERALFYTTQYDSTGWETVKLDMNNFIPLREYFKEFQAALGMSKKQIIECIGQRADHAFRSDSTQWDLPTEETYQELIKLNPNHGFTPKEYKFLVKDYETLRQEYEILRREYEILRRPFNADSKTFDVIEFPIVNGKSYHSTRKPTKLMNRIVNVITNPDQIVLDCCMGSGTTGVSCINLGRKFIGIELNKEYFDIAATRIKNASLQPPLFTEVEKPMKINPMF
jgi:site-specific DNA-methyltransferase (adenine-specific)